jgi:hypothetical protein
MNEVNPITNHPYQINPYRRALGTLISRAMWDLNPSSWTSRRKIKSNKGRHVGGKCVILCNGPSLLKVDFKLLEDSGVYTFGLNKINLLFSKNSFKPSAIIAVNGMVLEQNKRFYNETEIQLFLSSTASKFIKERHNVCFLHSTNVHGFARDCSLSVHNGGTVTYVAMQLAFHFGFEKVALVGCDHNFAIKGPANMTVQSGKEDFSHFDPNYFAGGVKWQLPDLARSEFFYSLAKDYYNFANRELINCTDGGCLEVFPRASLAKFLIS